MYIFYMLSFISSKSYNIVFMYMKVDNSTKKKLTIEGKRHLHAECHSRHLKVSMLED